MSARPKFATVEEYFDSLPPESRAPLEDIRRVARETVPEATETLSYGVPALKLRRVFFYYAAFKNHIGVYPPVTVDEDLVVELAAFRNEKGNMRFPLDKPLPLELIQRIVAALAEEYGSS